MSHRIAVIAGDGIGKEVMPQGLAVLDAAARRFGIELAFEHFDFASFDYFERHGTMLPDDWKERIGGHEAIFFGAVGWPAKIPDHVSLWGSLLRFRREFDQYANLRPARLMPGVRSPLVDRHGAPLKPGDIDMLIVRENTEGEYSSIGGRMYEGTSREIVIQETVMSRVGVDRVLAFAFEQAMQRPRRKLTSATKSNGISITMPYWDERVEAMAKQYPQIAVDRFHIDILAAHFVQRPQAFDVVVASNLFGDILTDLGGALQGSLGLPASANLNPERRYPSMFEPVHGSAPGRAGQGVANPMAAVWAAALMIDHLGEHEAATLVMDGLRHVARHGPRTRDLGGAALTTEIGAAIVGAIGASERSSI